MSESYRVALPRASAEHQPWRAARWIDSRHAVRVLFRAMIVTTLACTGDAMTCVYYPCAVFEAVTLSVSAQNAPSGIVGLVATVAGAVTGEASCAAAAITICHVPGPPGDYRITISAPGYASQQLQVAVAGVPAGCNTCGHVDRQERSVVMQPAPSN